MHSSSLYVLWAPKCNLCAYEAIELTNWAPRAWSVTGSVAFIFSYSSFAPFLSLTQIHQTSHKQNSNGLGGLNQNNLKA
jgi:hypothetical protein